jgi:hypothetical protein
VISADSSENDEKRRVDFKINIGHENIGVKEKSFIF